MAKIRKQKPGEQKEQSLVGSDRLSCAVVRHEKLCLSIDVPSHRLHGYAELKVVAPTKGVVGLHAQGLNIKRVLYDGVPTDYELLHACEPDTLKSSLVQKVPTSAIEASDIAYSDYFRALEKELAPELLIFVPEACVSPQQRDHDVIQSELKPESNGIGSNGKLVTDPKSEDSKEEGLTQPEERVKVVHVEYWLEKPASGGHFLGNVFHTSNQLRRARCWFPCVDLDFQRCSYEMEFTVDSRYVAVSSGKLLYQVISKEGSHLKTYVYSLDIPVAARFISLVVAPLAVHPDDKNPLISHFCIPTRILHLRCTVGFFHDAFSFYEKYLGASFPFGSCNQVFIDSEFLVRSASVGAGITIFSSHLLVDDRIIDQTMNTRIKLARSLAQQWFGIYISPESPNDEWLLEGLSFYLTDLFIKEHFGHNEAYYRLFKANEAVCKGDIDGFPPLSSAFSFHGTQTYGALGQIYSWKALSVVQMLEKQMGSEAFQKILQRVIVRAQNPVRKSRTLSSKEFRHLVNRLGNLERPFLKDFFSRWVECSGCPVLRVGFEHNKRRNMIELAVHRSCTSSSENVMEAQKPNAADEKVKGPEASWPGMMSIRVNEVDGMYDHPSLPMAGDAYQLVEIQCHSKLGGRRIQRPKKGNKMDGAEELEMPAAADTRQSLESPLLWLRIDPQMEYLADIQLQQQEQMWINQLEKDKNVVAQCQAIAALSSLPEKSFAVLNALNNCLVDSKVFYRVRRDAAFALASASTQANGWAGLTHLLTFYKGQRFDSDMGLPRPNDFGDLAEYFVLEVIPEAIATVRGSDGKSPPEAVEFILQLLKHNDNSRNQFSDVFWVAFIINSIGSLEFGQQSLEALRRILKHVDWFLQYDRIMPSYNHLVTTSCIHVLTKLGLKFSSLLALDRLQMLLSAFKDNTKVHWRVRSVALRALLELEIHVNGLNSGINLAFDLINADPSARVQSKVFGIILHMIALLEESKDSVQNATLHRLVLLLQSKKGFNNSVLRHHVFCILQVLAGRSATLFGMQIPDTHMEPLVVDVSVEPQTVQEPLATDPTTVKVQLIQQQPEAVVEQRRLRLKTSGSQSLKEMGPTLSGTSSAKQESDKKITVFKFRLKPASSAQDNTVEDTATRNNRAGVGPVQSSSMSVDMGVKREPDANESPNSIQHVGATNLSIREEGYGVDNSDVQNEPSSSVDMSVGDNGEGQQRRKTVLIKRLAVIKPRIETLKTLDDRIESSVGVSVSGQQNDVSEDQGIRYGQGEQMLDSAVQRQVVKPEEDYLSKSEKRDSEDGPPAHKHKKKKRNGEERKDGNKKKDPEREKQKRDKHADPEYREKKRLKKERKRQQQLMLLQQEQQQQHWQRQQEEQHHASSIVERSDGAHEPATSKAKIEILQPRPPSGTSETVYRFKIKPIVK